MVHIIRPEVKSGSANLRPCIGPHGQLIELTETRCDAFWPVPVLPGEKVVYRRCPRGVCKAHDCSGTLWGHRYEHLCPDCFLKLMKAPGSVATPFGVLT